MTVYSLIHSLHIVWPLNSLMAGEELLKPPVCVSPAPSQIRLFIFQQRTSSRKKKTPNTQMSFVPVSLSVCTSTSKKEVERKQDPERGPNSDGALFISSLAPRRLGRRCQRVRAAATFPALTLKRARCSMLPQWVQFVICLARFPLPVCPPSTNPITLPCSGRSSSGQPPSGKKRRTWRGGKERCRKGHIWTTCQLRRYQNAGPCFPRP